MRMEEGTGAGIIRPTARKRQDKLKSSDISEISKEVVGGRSHIRVQSSPGYLCHIDAEIVYPCPPHIIYDILASPDNTTVFRDLKDQVSRNILEEEPEVFRIVELEQIGEIKALWKTYKFSTFLRVTEDKRNGCFSNTFSLIRSDVMSKFQGKWTMLPGPSSGDSKAGTAQNSRVVFEQDILPVGMPVCMARMPMLGSTLRAICVRSVRRILEDIAVVVQRYNSGSSLEEAMRPGPPKQSCKAAKPSLRSFAITDFDGSDDEDEPSAEVNHSQPETKSLSSSP